MATHKILMKIPTEGIYVFVAIEKNIHYMGISFKVKRHIFLNMLLRGTYLFSQALPIVMLNRPPLIVSIKTLTILNHLHNSS